MVILCHANDLLLSYKLCKQYGIFVDCWLVLLALFAGHSLQDWLEDLEPGHDVNNEV